MTAPTPHDHAERVQGEVTAAVRRAAEANYLTRAGFRDDSREMYRASGPEVLQSWADATRPILAAALDVEEMARVQVSHDRRIWSSGEVECACGEWQVTRDAEGYKRSTNEFRAEAVRAHMDHVATALRAALLGGAA